MAMRLVTALSLAMALVAMTAAGCGQENGIVGGTCAAGFTQCDVSCFDLLTDNLNCGACGNVCPAGKQCAGGVCGGSVNDATVDGTVDGGELDGADLDGTGQYCDVLDENVEHCHPIDGSIDGGDASDGSNDGPIGDGPLLDGDGQSDGNPVDACVPPFDTPANCGSCGNVCTGATPVCTPVDGGFACAPLCTPPLVDCAHQCVDETSDPRNCGACFVFCPSGICSASLCQGKVAGNIAYLGHDFLATQAAEQQAKLLTNSVFYNNTNAVRVLSFEEYASAGEVKNVRALLVGYAAAHNVALTITTSNSDTDVPTGALAKKDVLLVHDQPNAPVGKMDALGAAWATTMAQFTQSGGIVLVLDSDKGRAEMPAFATSGALLAVTSHATLAPGSTVNVTAPGTIARGMTSVYPVDANSAHFTTSEASSSILFYVATDPASSELVAVHKIIN